MTGFKKAILRYEKNSGKFVFKKNAANHQFCVKEDANVIKFQDANVIKFLLVKFSSFHLFYSLNKDPNFKKTIDLILLVTRNIASS